MKKQAGFTLLEIVISMAIFSLIIGGVVIFGIKTIDVYTKSHAMSVSLQNAQFAIESISKKIRVSNNLVTEDDEDFASEKKLFFVENVTDEQVCYKFENGALQVASIPIATEQFNNCEEMENSGNVTFSDLVGTSGDMGRTTVDGFFYVIKTNETVGQQGMVRIVLNIKHNASSKSISEQGKVTIQTSVSLNGISYTETI